MTIKNYFGDPTFMHIYRGINGFLAALLNNGFIMTPRRWCIWEDRNGSIAEHDPSPFI